MESYKSSSSSEEVSGKPLVGDDDVKRPKRPPLPKEYEGDPDLEKGSVNLLGDSDLDDEGPDILPLPRQYIGRLRGDYSNSPRDSNTSLDSIPPLPRNFIDSIKGEHDIVPLYDDTDSVLSDEPPPPIPPKPTDSEKSPPPRPESPADSDLSLPSKASSDSKRRPLSVHDGDTVDGWKPSPKDEEPVELQAIPPPLVHEEPETEAETSFITPVDVPSENVLPTNQPEVTIPGDRDIEIQPSTDKLRKKKPLLLRIVVFIIAGVIILTLILMLILLPMTFSYLDYYRVGMKEKSSTGEVYEKKVYPSGRHAIGPDHHFRQFSSVAHFVEMDDLAIATVDKLQFVIQCTFQYFLREDELSLLFENYDMDYDQVIQSVAYSTIKNAATQFYIDDYLKERRKVEKGLHKALRLKLGGNCCPPNLADCYLTDLCDDCSREENCDKGYHVDVRYFQLGQVLLPESLLSRFLNQQLLLIEAETELFLQEYSVTQKVTDSLKQDIVNQARELNATGEATANLIRLQSQAVGSALVESAHSEGLMILYRSIGANTADLKASLNLFFTLDKHPNLIMGLEYKDYLRTVRG